VVLALLFLACSRAVNVSTPSPVFAVAVTNASGTELIVSYDDGSGAKALGSVRAGATERFVIAAPARVAITISGRSPSGMRTAGPVAIELAAGETRPVTLR
jgi:hypothetical protein